jgi:hypothetical protein
MQMQGADNNGSVVNGGWQPAAASCHDRGDITT